MGRKSSGIQARRHQYAYHAVQCHGRTATHQRGGADETYEACRRACEPGAPRFTGVPFKPERGEPSGNGEVRPDVSDALHIGSRLLAPKAAWLRTARVLDGPEIEV